MNRPCNHEWTLYQSALEIYILKCIKCRQLIASDIFNIHTPLDFEVSCEHDWEKYQGLFEVEYTCRKCGAKINEI